jgi:prepilin-type processing-associated H-X9-DG protein
LDKIEEKTGKTPRELVAEAHARGYGAAAVKTGTILDWLKADYDLGRGHGMALVHVIKNGPGISDKHVGRPGPHGDPSNMLWLDGKATNPALR